MLHANYILKKKKIMTLSLLVGEAKQDALHLWTTIFFSLNWKHNLLELLWGWIQVMYEKCVA